LITFLLAFVYPEQRSPAFAESKDEIPAWQVPKSRYSAD